MSANKRHENELEAELKKLLIKIGEEPISDDMRSMATKLQTLLDARDKEKS